MINIEGTPIENSQVSLAFSTFPALIHQCHYCKPRLITIIHQLKNSPINPESLQATLNYARLHIVCKNCTLADEQLMQAMADERGVKDEPFFDNN